MDRFLHSSFPVQSCKRSTFQLAFTWLLGLVSGSAICILAQSGNWFTSGTTLVVRRTVISQLLIAILPLLCSVLAVFIGRPKLLIVIAFAKAFLFSYVCFNILLSCSRAQWLIQLLVMFSDTLMLPILWWYWLKSPDKRQAFACTAAAVIPALFVIFLDSCIIMPVLANLT